MTKAQLVPRFPHGKTHAFTMSYDDSVTTDLRLVRLMRENGVRGTFNLISGRMAATAQEYPKGKWGSLTAVQCAALYGDDMEMAVHTRTHPFLTKLPTAEALREVLDDRAALEALSGGLVRGMAYPYGAYNDEVVALVRASGIAYSRTTLSTERFDVPTDWLRLPTTCHHNHPRLMELADSFLQPVGRYGDPKLFYLWGHSYEFERDDNWGIIERFLQRIGGHSDVWYATNIEIYDYMQAYHGLLWNVGCTAVKNPSATDVWICLHELDDDEHSPVIRIPAGETLRLN